jgi:c(7)-type cytochrome triheme protein
MRIMDAARKLISPSAPWLAGFGLVFIAQTLFLHGSAVRSGPQPIAFNHAKHIASGLECVNCHTGARTEEHATVPALAMCMTCHESALSKSPEEAKIRAFAAAGREIPWQPVTHVPAHVYFSHRRHVQLAGLECSACHGAMEKLTAPPRVPNLQLDMDTCIACHQKKQARTDCNDCHR